MKLLTLIQQNFDLFRDVEELGNKTGKSGMDNIWLSSLSEEINKLPESAVHKKEMSKKVDDLKKNDNAVSIAVKELFAENSYLLSRYENKFDKNHQDEDKLIEFVLPIKTEKNDYTIRCSIPLEMEFINSDLKNNEKLIAQNEYLISKKIHFNIDIEENVNGIRKTIASFNEKSRIKENALTVSFEDLLTVDNDLLANMVEKNPANKNYRDQRNLIPQILTRAKKDNFMVPATHESVKILQEIITQEKILGLKVKSIQQPYKPKLGN